jgi:sugar (pentulose or hexulose) kinase
VEALGGPVDEVLTSGGWSRNPVLRRLKAEAFPPMTYPVVAEAGIRGAALLAGLAAEVFGDVTDFPSPELEVVR